MPSQGSHSNGLSHPAEAEQRVTSSLDPASDLDLRRVLVVMAHPDDIEHLAAGTIAHWIDRGVEVTYCVVTDGSAGGADADASADQVGRIRRKEQLAAAAVLGVEDVHFLGYPDGQLSNTVALRGDLVRLIREVRPHRLLTHSPERNWNFIPDAHPDHRACGRAAVEALYPEARNARAHPDLLRTHGLEPWTIAQLWMVGSPTPNHFSDVTSTFEVKLAALLTHGSQVDDEAALAQWLRERLAGQALRGGLAPGRLAEEFHIVSTVW